MAEIVPAILPKSYDELDRRLGEIVGSAKVVEIDICDGIFTPEKSWPYAGDGGEFADITSEKEGLPFWSELDFEIHLMVENPETEIEKWVAAGASRIVVHAEAVKNLNVILEKLNGRAELGLAFNLKTPLEKLGDVFDKIDFVQCMGISNVGFQGGTLDDQIFEKIKNLKKNYPHLLISVDGGVKEENAKKLVEGGARRLVVGSAIFREGSPSENFKRFVKLVE